jgi:hypothetical protein
MTNGAKDIIKNILKAAMDLAKLYSLFDDALVLYLALVLISLYINIESINTTNINGTTALVNILIESINIAKSLGGPHVFVITVLLVALEYLLVTATNK